MGPYEIVAQLGAGGMGEVYRARDKKLDRDVAIKVLSESVAADPDALSRFAREAKAVAALSHPNILSIFDFGTHDGVSYAVMELLEGETLRRHGAAPGQALPKKRCRRTYNHSVRLDPWRELAPKPLRRLRANSHSGSAGPGLPLCPPRSAKVAIAVVFHT